MGEPGQGIAVRVDNGGKAFFEEAQRGVGGRAEKIEGRLLRLFQASGDLVDRRDRVGDKAANGLAELGL